MVLVDKLTKSSHFVPIQSNFKAAKIANVYMKEISRLHGIPKAIVYDRFQVYFKLLEGFIQIIWNQTQLQ